MSGHGGGLELWLLVGCSAEMQQHPEWLGVNIQAARGGRWTADNSLITNTTYQKVL